MKKEMFLLKGGLSWGKQHVTNICLLAEEGGGKNEEMRKVDARKRERKKRKEKKRKEKKKRKKKRKKKEKENRRSSALGIRMWSPTILLTQPTDA